MIYKSLLKNQIYVNILDNRIKRINTFPKVDIHQNNKRCLFTIRFVETHRFVMGIVLN